MAELQLIRPEAGQRVVVPATPDARITLAFSAADALLTREGDDLVFSFEGGAAVVISDFYTSYTRDTLPEFVIDGTPIEGEQFFAALSEDLMPAAGPAAGVPAGGAFRTYDNMNLYDGIDRLDGLDLGLTRDTQYEDRLPGGFGDVGGGAVGGGAVGVDTTVSNLSPLVISHAGLVIEDDPLNSLAGGSVLTGSTPGNPEHTVTLVDGPESPYGRFTLNPDGTWSYQLLNERGEVQSLAKGESLQEVYTFTYTDVDGGSATGTVTVTINGTNDAPTLEVTHPVINVSEGAAEAAADKRQTVEGESTGKDVDNGAVLDFGFAVRDANGNMVLDADGAPQVEFEISDAYGTLKIDPETGTYSYTLNGDANVVQQLGKNDVVSRDYTVLVRDEHGAWGEQTVTVNITGQNDAPTIGYEKIHLKEEGVFGGNTETAPDFRNANNGYVFPDQHRVSISDTLADNVKDLDSGDTHTFGVSFTDTTANIYRGGNSSDYVTDADGNKISLPVDVLESSLKDGIQTIKTNYGTFTLNTATGAYTFVLDGPDANKLGQGEKIDFMFKTTVSDGTASGDHMLGITIEGTNDVPTLSLSTPSLEANEHGTASGTASATDDDARDTHEFGIFNGMAKDDPSTPFDESKTPATYIELKGEYGTLTIDSVTGVYTYKPDHSNPAVSGMKPGDSLEESFKLVVTDKNGAFDIEGIKVTITGENDAPIVTVGGLTVQDDGYRDGNVHVPGTPDASAKITVTDVDKGDDEAGFTFSLKGDGYTTETDDAGAVWQVKETDYGTFRLNTATGEYDYTIKSDADVVNKLADYNGFKGKYDDVFQVTVTGNRDGLSTDATINVEVRGNNEKPTLTLGDDNATLDGFNLTLTEGDFSDSGKAGTVDVDSQDTHEFYISKDGAVADNPNTPANESDLLPKDLELSLKGEYGTLYINKTTGDYRYELDNTDDRVKGLSDGDSIKDSFHILAKDKAGAFDIKDLNVEINGTDDAPVFVTGANVLNVIEAGVVPGGNTDAPGTLVVEGQATATDDDLADQGKLTYGLKATDSDGKPLETTSGTNDLGHATVTITTLYGSLTLDTLTGKYTYTLSDTETVNRLKPGQTVEDLFNITVTDGDFVAEQPLKVNVQGTNDRPFITDVVNVDVTENATDNVFTGKVMAGDWEDHALRFSLVNGKTIEPDGTVSHEGNSVQTMPGQLEGKYGYLTIDEATGEYTYHWYADKVQGLGADQTVTESFTVRVTDALGAYTDTVVNVTINGTDNAPTISGGTNGTVEEDGPLLPDVPDYPAVKGTVQVKDLDTGDDRLGLDPDTPRSFSFGFDADGKPILSVTGFYGIISIDPATGEYSYVLTSNGDDIIQGLNAGEHFDKEPPFKVTITTGRGETTSTVEGSITIDIVGRNDDPEITGADNLVVNKDGVLDAEPVNGQMTAQDIDTNDGTADNPLLFYVGDKDALLQTVEGTYGALTIDANGKYSYTLNAYSEAFKGIGVGNSQDETFTLMVSDGHGGYAEKTITVTVNGTVTPTNPGTGGDKPLPSGADVLVTEEDGTSLTPNGLIADTGRLISGDGSPFIPSQSGQYVTFEGGKQTVVGTYGAITIDPATGEYTYTLNNNSSTVQGLNEGQQVKESFDIYINGVKTPVSVDLTITGDNDRPEITRTDSLSMTESLDPDAVVSASGFVVAKDVDLGTTFVYKLLDADGNPVDSITTKYGTVTIDPATGEYTYILNDASGLLNADTILKDSFKVVINDQSGADNATKETTVNVTLNGTNEAPTLTLATLALSEDGTLVATGTAQVADDTTTGFTFAVTDQAGTVQGNGMFQPGQFGMLILDAKTGQYSYRLDNNHKDVQSLGEGESRTETFYLTVTDKHGATHTEQVDITIEGRNDAPELFLDARLVAREGEGTVIEREASVLDLDANDSHTFDLSDTGGTRAEVTDETGKVVQITYTTSYGVFAIDPATGKYSFTLNDDSEYVKSLAADEIHRETVTVTVSDGHTTTSRDVSVDIIGTNSAPVVTAPTASTLVEDSATSVSGALNVTDVDQGAALTYALVKGTSPIDQLDGTYGSIKLDPSTGAYTYTLGKSIQSLAEGASYDETFKVWVTDQFGAKVETEITVTLVGTNDAPTLTLKGDDGKNLDADGRISLTEPDSGEISYTGSYVGKDVDIDPDTGKMEALAFRVTDEHGNSIDSSNPFEAMGQYGLLILNPDGTYSYQVDASQADSFAGGATYTDKFWVTVDDGNGGTQTKPIEFTITGVNDAPDLTLWGADGMELGTDGRIDLSERAEQADKPDAEGSLSYTGSFTGVDVDIDPLTGTMEALTFQITDADGKLLSGSDPYTVTGSFGTLTINPVDGTFTYTLSDDHADNLLTGENYQDQFWITVSDGKGGSEVKALEFDLVGPATGEPTEVLAPTSDPLLSSAAIDVSPLDTQDGSSDMELARYILEHGQG